MIAVSLSQVLTEKAMLNGGGIPQSLYDMLREVERERGRTISYWELAPVAGIDRNNPHYAPLVGRLLDEINRAENAANRPLLSAIVCGKRAERTRTRILQASARAWLAQRAR